MGVYREAESTKDSAGSAVYIDQKHQLIYVGPTW